MFVIRKCFKSFLLKTCGKHFSSSTLNSVIGLDIFNSLSKRKSPILTKHPGVLTWYICGPTVYDSSHIGHAWCYVNFDIMRRVMEHYFDLNVIQVMNITDIDDKIIKKAMDEKIDFKEVAYRYEKVFLNDLETLSVQKPTVLTKVTDFIPQIISFIDTLLHQDLAYKTSDGSVYFNLNAYSKNYKYGKLKPFQISSPTDGDKSTSNDFALWKAAKSSSEPSWVPTWGGKGRPGWHIECSAMASYIFGSWVDVHSGGMDLLFPHHENEEAQCCAYHGTQQWTGHWIHANLLNLPDGAKMSKSLKNIITIQEFLKTHSADQFRMMCLLSSYRNGMEYTDASLKLAKDAVDSIRIFISDCHTFIRNSSSSPSSIDSTIILTTLNETKLAVKVHLGDDFNTAQATAAVRKLIQLTRKEMTKPDISNQQVMIHNHGIEAVSSVLNFVTKYFSTLGFSSIGNSLKNNSETDSSPIIDSFVAFRNQVRQHALAIKFNQQRKNDDEDAIQTKQILLTACDRIREELKVKGIQLKDHEKSSTWTLSR